MKNNELKNVLNNFDLKNLLIYLKNNYELIIYILIIIPYIFFGLQNSFNFISLLCNNILIFFVLKKYFKKKYKTNKKETNKKRGRPKKVEEDENK